MSEPLPGGGRNLAGPVSSPGSAATAPRKKSKPAGRVPVARGTLSQALILRTSLDIIDHDGLAGLTVRKLADRLGVSAMAIYRYYKNKAEIERGLVDLVVGDYDVTNHQEDDWREWLHVTYAGMRAALCAHPGVMPLLDDASYQGGRALATMERILQELARAGLTPEQSARLFHLLMANMIGSVVLMNGEARRLVAFGQKTDTPIASPSPRKRSFEQVTLDQFPHIAALAPHLLTLAETTRFRDSVMLIIRAVTEQTVAKQA